MNSQKRVIICINTCNRFDLFKVFSWDYYRICQEREGYFFVVSLDGKDQTYLDFFHENKIPAIYSEEREGIGLAKNRVLEAFPDFEHYFFIEDDTELLDEDYFEKQISISKKTNIPHFSVFDKRRLKGEQSSFEIEGERVLQAMFGSAQVNYFTREGLELIGGWHTEFAKYKRFGHTEHTYRFYWRGLVKLPFHMVESFAKESFEWHDPPMVTDVRKLEINQNHVAEVEQEIIDQKLEHFPLQTISNYQLINSEQPRPQTPKWYSEREIYEQRANLLFLDAEKMIYRKEKAGVLKMIQLMRQYPKAGYNLLGIKILLKNFPLVFKGL